MAPQPQGLEGRKHTLFLVDSIKRKLAYDATLIF